MSFKNIIFDLDGTLIDSAPGIEFAAEKAIADVISYGSNINIRKFIGPPIREVFKNALYLNDEEILDKLTKVFRRAYDESGWQKTNIYPGVQETLSCLKQLNVSNFIVTNKPKLPTGKILKHLALQHFFLEVVTPDSQISSFKSKIKSLAYLCGKYHLQINESVYIGDSDEDRHVSESSGMQFLHAAYGYGKILSREGSFTGSVLNKITDLLEIVRKEDL